MEKARVIWERLGPARLRPKTPWFGYLLGPWPQEWLDDAAAAVRGEYHAVGDRLAKGRKPFFLKVAS